MTLDIRCTSKFELLNPAALAALAGRIVEDAPLSKLSHCPPAEGLGGKLFTHIYHAGSDVFLSSVLLSAKQHSILHINISQNQYSTTSSSPNIVEDFPPCAQSLGARLTCEVEGHFSIRPSTLVSPLSEFSIDSTIFPTLFRVVHPAQTSRVSPV